MERNPQVKEIVTVAEMARMVGLSRSRFYSLLSEGIMPVPSRHQGTGRPFYNREQQDQCLLVRRTNCGVNGKPILFYSLAPRSSQIKKAKPKSQSPKAASSSQVGGDPLMEDLKHGLSQLGMVEMTDAKLSAVLADCYPDGHRGLDSASVLMTVFRHLRCQNPNDNVA